MIHLLKSAKDFVGYNIDAASVMHVFNNVAEVEGEVITYSILNKLAHTTIWKNINRVVFGKWTLVDGNFVDEISMNSDSTWNEFFKILKENENQ